MDPDRVALVEPLEERVPEVQVQRLVGVPARAVGLLALVALLFSA